MIKKFKNLNSFVCDQERGRKPVNFNLKPVSRKNDGLLTFEKSSPKNFFFFVPNHIYYSQCQHSSVLFENKN
jgi:hypothetical protein